MKRKLVIACCMLAVLFSCAHPRKEEFEAIRAQSQQYYDAGEYQRALDSYRTLHTRYPKDSVVAESYISMFETIKKESDRAYGRGEYATAYKMYRLLPAYYDDLSRDKHKLSFSKSYLTARIKSAEMNLAEKTSHHYIASGDFQKALEVCSKIYQKYRKDAQSQKCLVTAASELGEKANTAYAKGEYAEAGKIYALLRKNAKTFKTAAIPATSDMQALDQRLVNCCNHLNRKGLELYRKGELRKALTVWKSILEFDPDNAEVKKTVDTTSEQIENMQ